MEESQTCFDVNQTASPCPSQSAEGSPALPSLGKRSLSGNSATNAPENGSTSTNPPSTSSAGIANCYVFKSRLQEYAQKVGISTPVYETLMEGPSHEPVFRSTVIVNNIKYDSLPGFFNRKAAEQSAAEIALMELTKSGQMTECIPTVHETGLCKNLLQEYAQKMNYAIPSYHCTKKPKGSEPFTCTIEIGGIQYIGAAARTKKEAEIKAARTALLAIQSAPMACTSATSQYTVLPSKKKGMGNEKPQPEPVNQVKPKNQFKPKKTKFKKKWSKRKLSRRKDQKFMKSNSDDQSGEVNAGTLVLPDVDDDMNEARDCQKVNVLEISAMEVKLQGQEARQMAP